MKWWKGTIRRLKDDMVFVFGSNPEGRHGMGAAKTAMRYGAKYGQGRGMMGQAYGLITKNLKPGFIEKDAHREIVYPRSGPRSLTPDQIKENIFDLYTIATALPTLRFIVVYTAYSDNLNGYTPSEMWKMFTAFQVPPNIYFHESFKGFI